MLGLKLDRWAGGWADDPPSSHLDSNPRWRGQWNLPCSHQPQSRARMSPDIQITICQPRVTGGY